MNLFTLLAAAAFAIGGLAPPKVFIASPTRHTTNGGTPTGVAGAKRAARKRRNVRKQGGAA